MHNAHAPINAHLSKLHRTPNARTPRQQSTSARVYYAAQWVVFACTVSMSPRHFTNHLLHRGRVTVLLFVWHVCSSCFVVIVTIVVTMGLLSSKEEAPSERPESVVSSSTTKPSANLQPRQASIRQSTIKAKSKQPMPDPAELERRFTKVLVRSFFFRCWLAAWRGDFFSLIINNRRGLLWQYFRTHLLIFVFRVSAEPVIRYYVRQTRKWFICFKAIVFRLKL